MSSFTTALWTKAATGLLARPHGWIGVDIGSRTIKLAEVERLGTQWKMAARWQLPHDAAFTPSEDSFLGGVFAKSALPLRKARGLFRGRQIAFTLPMSLTHLRSFDLPKADPQEMRCMVREELAAELNEKPDDFTFDFWETPEQTLPAADQVRITALAASKRVSLRASQDLLGLGLESRLLDGLPCALARAVQMAHSESAEAPLAALDLGFSSAQFVVAVEGRPVFCRALRNCGLNQFVQQLGEGLSLSPEECQQLLARIGISDAATAVSGSAAHGIMQLVAAPLGDLLSELERTWSYLNQQYSNLRPQQLYLLGGGATIRHLAEHIAARLEVPTHVWSLRPEESSPDAGDAVFGVAAALSAAAWENS